MDMKKVFFALAAIFATLIPFQAAFADEIIHDFTVTATVDSERRYTVTEQITYDFGENERHGIYRDIPITYLRNGVGYDFHPRVVSVYMDGHTEMYEESRESGMLQIKIGDPNETTNGVHQFKITYATDRAINFFPSGSELYWNVTGNQWPVAIERASFMVTLPESAAATELPMRCYTGPVGSTEEACSFTQKKNTVAFKTTRVLLPEDGFTVVVGIPPGVIRAPTAWEKALMVVQDNGVFALPFIALFIMLAIWWRKGRDPKMSTIIPIYEPPEKMTPAELSAMEYDGGVPRRGTTGTILDLARRGYLHIKSVEEKKLIGKKIQFTFIKQKEPDASVKDDEREILNGIFATGNEVTPEDLADKHEFYKNVQKASEAVWKRLAAMELFDGRPATVRAVYIGSGFIAGFVLYGIFQAVPLGGAMSLVTAAVIVIVGWYMPRRTQKGTKLMADVKGFEWFMSVTEKDRLDFHNAPERSSTQFLELLPYAVALGIEKKWAEQFEGITIDQPEWAEGSTWSTMNAAAFATHMNALSMNAMSAASPPGSSGFSGGSSGGGGGGGGGGSW